MDVSAWWPLGGPWVAARAQAVSSMSMKRLALKGARVGAYRVPVTMCCSLCEWARWVRGRPSHQPRSCWDRGVRVQGTKGVFCCCSPPVPSSCPQLNLSKVMGPAGWGEVAKLREALSFLSPQATLKTFPIFRAQNEDKAVP